jgi:hypothetical protein
MVRWSSKAIITAMTASALTVALAAVPAGAGQGNVKKFCTASLALDKAFDADQPNVKKVNRLLDTLAKIAPTAIAEPVGVAVPAFKADPESAFEDPEVAAAVGEIEEFEYENCSDDQVEVTLEDYRFTGLPDELDKGKVGFRLDNLGNDAHEMFVVKLKGDTTLDELIAADESEFDRLAQSVGGGFALPGEVSYATVQFKKPGRYAAVCFIPVGTTATDEGTGPPHATEGMATEFEVG